MDFVTRHMAGARDPFPRSYPWYVLLEISGARANGEARAALEGLLADALEASLALDATLAASMAQARDLWRLREGISEAQKFEGGNIKHDVSVPIARIPEFIAQADAAIERICPGARPIPLGHFGDGNVHYNIAQPVGMDRNAFMALSHAFNRAVHDLSVALGGSFSAEHGIGRMKRAELARLKDPVALDVMRAIKAAFDPNGILNPGKVV
jgi:FAD/FMN-containing dehydrogenase